MSIATWAGQPSGVGPSLPDYSYTEQIERAEAAMADDFLRACARADANAIATWAPRVTDYTGQPYLIGDRQVRPQRYQTVAEVMTESLDYSEGPPMVDAMQIVLNAAAGSDVKAQATGLLKRMAGKFAEMNAGVA